MNSVPLELRLPTATCFSQRHKTELRELICLEKRYKRIDLYLWPSLRPLIITFCLRPSFQKPQWAAQCLWQVSVLNPEVMEHSECAALGEDPTTGPFLCLVLLLLSFPQRDLKHSLEGWRDTHWGWEGRLWPWKPDRLPGPQRTFDLDLINCALPSQLPDHDIKGKTRGFSTYFSPHPLTPISSVPVNSGFLSVSYL